MTWRPARTRCMRGTSAPPRSCGKSRSPPRERRGSTSSSTRAASAGCPTRTSTAKTIPRMPATSVIRVPRLGLGAKIFVASTVSVAAVLGGALVANALSGEPTNGAWLDDRLRRLFEAVAVPLRASANAAPQGVLIAAYAVDDSLAQAIKQATTTDVVFFALDSLDRPYIVGSTLPREEVEPALVADTAAIGALRGGGGRDSAGTEVTADGGGERLIGP